jgi:hypothetical protein
MKTDMMPGRPQAYRIKKEFHFHNKFSSSGVTDGG